MSLRKPLVFLALLVVVLGRQSSFSSADEPTPAAPSLEELEAVLIERSPSMGSLKARVHAFEASVDPSGALPDPMVDFYFQDVGFPDLTVGSEEMSMAGLEVRQDLLFPGKRKARKNAAAAEASLRDAELGRFTQKLVTDLRILYAKIYALDRETETLRAARELLEVLEATVATRYSTGETGQEAVLKVQLELSRLLERTDDLAAKRKALVSELNRLLDLPGDAPLGVVSKLPGIPSAKGNLESLALSRSPDVLVKKAAVKAAESQLKTAILEKRPNLSVGSGAAYRGDFDPLVTLRVGVELPLWSKEKQRPLVAAREFELQMAHHDLRESEATVRSQLVRLLADLENATRQASRYQEAILPQSGASLNAARASYLAGQGDFSSVIEDFGIWLQARVQLARREADRFTAWAKLVYVSGSTLQTKEGEVPYHE